MAAVAGHARRALGRSRAGAFRLAGAGDRRRAASWEATSPASWPARVTGCAACRDGRPSIEPGDPPIEWLIGDLRDADVRRRALAGVRGVIHTASWVCLGLDPRGNSQAINVEATARLLAEAAQAGVERFVYTSTLYTLAAGTAGRAGRRVHGVEPPAGGIALHADEARGRAAGAEGEPAGTSRRSRSARGW